MRNSVQRGLHSDKWADRQEGKKWRKQLIKPIILRGFLFVGGRAYVSDSSERVWVWWTFLASLSLDTALGVNSTQSSTSAFSGLG